MGGYEYLEDEAIADVAFKAHAESLETLFYQAAMATASLQTDLKQLDQSESRELRIEKSDIDRLLKALLDEILYYKDAELLFATDFVISITNPSDNQFVLEAEIKGGYFNFDVHPMHNDLKAITWHDFRVSETEDGYECYVLIDI